MEQVIYEFYEELKRYTNKEVPSFSLEIQKYQDDYYVIGDRLDVFQVDNVLYGGARQSQFLLFFNMQKPYIFSVCQWKNAIFLENEMFTFVHQTMFRLLEQLHYEGVLQVNIGYKGSEYIKRYELGEHYKNMLDIIDSAINSNKRMHQNGGFQYNHGKNAGLFWIEITSEGLELQKHNETYSSTIQSIQDWKELYQTLQEKEKEIVTVKEKINQYITDIPRAKWEHPNYLCIGEKTIFSHLEVIILNGEFQYIFRINPYQEIICKDIHEVYTNIKQKIDVCK